MKTLLGDRGLDNKSDSFNIKIDEASGVQKVAESNTLEQDNGKTLSESATRGRGWSIFRVPAHVREVDNRAYSPRIVSIGPFHHNQEALRAFEDQKKRFLSRLQNQRSRGCVVDLENAMKEMEEKTRKCYSEDFGGINSDDFVRMMLLDGCFIVELLRLHTTMTTSKGNGDVEEPILETRWMVPNIGRDLLMLENQLPMFVLQKIYDITTLETKAITPLNELALRFFEPLRPGKDKLSDNILNTNQEHAHLLALFQSTFMNPKSSGPKRDNQSKYEKIPGKGWVHNATTLTYTGVRFKKKSSNFLNIEYKNKVLTIPTLYIDEGTSTLLRNLIAYEQSYRSAKRPYFSCLAVFLDCIVDTVDDINILRRGGIIKQAKGGDQEVVDLFNSLTKELEIDMDDCYMMKQIDDVNRHHKTHEAMVRFYRTLSKLNFMRFITAYISTLLTLIYIWSTIKVCDCKDGDHKG